MQTVEFFEREAFELCARSNLEHALEVLERHVNTSAIRSVERVRHENAAATIRELLSPTSSYTTPQVHES